MMQVLTVLIMCNSYILVFSCLGDIQIGMVEKKGALEVEVIRARGLVGKPSSKALPGERCYSFWRWFHRHQTHRSRLNSICCCSSPAPYVKVYLLENGACIAKKKTKVARKTLDPLYQQQLSFEESPGGKVLQVLCHISNGFIYQSFGRYLVIIQSISTTLSREKPFIFVYKLFRLHNITQNLHNITQYNRIYTILYIKCIINIYLFS